MWLTGKKTDIEAYISKVDGYNGYEGNETATWAMPRKHPTKDLYAVQKNESVEPDAKMKEVQELPNDWQSDNSLA